MQHHNVTEGLQLRSAKTPALPSPVSASRASAVAFCPSSILLLMFYEVRTNCFSHSEAQATSQERHRLSSSLWSLQDGLTQADRTDPMLHHFEMDAMPDML